MAKKTGRRAGTKNVAPAKGSYAEKAVKAFDAKPRRALAIARVLGCNDTTVSVALDRWRPNWRKTLKKVEAKNAP